MVTVLVAVGPVQCLKKSLSACKLAHNNYKQDLEHMFSSDIATLYFVYQHSALTLSRE